MKKEDKKRYVHINLRAHHTPQLNKSYNFFSIATDNSYFDDEATLASLNEKCDTCYLPTNRVLIDMIRVYGKKFRFSLDISASLLEQLTAHRSDVLHSFQTLVATGAVDLVLGTAYNSLASVESDAEFINQIKLQKKALKKYFKKQATVFVNTGLIYSNHICDLLAEQKITGVITEGAKNILGWRSPHFVYQPVKHYKMKLMFRDFSLSDLITFRFSDENAEGYPFTAQHFAKSIMHGLKETKVINLMFDYDIFGYYHKLDSGILSFLYHLPHETLQQKGIVFGSPNKIFAKEDPIAKVDVPHAVSFAGVQKDISAWTGSAMQQESLTTLFELGDKVLASKNQDYISLWRKLQDADFFMAMDTQWHQDLVYTTNEFESPEAAYLIYSNILTDFYCKFE